MPITPPRHLSAEAKKEWRRLNKEIEFQPSDVSTLTLYVEAMERYTALSQQLKEEGMTIVENVFGRSGNQVGTRIVRHPSLVTLKEQSGIIMSCARALGLNEIDEDSLV